MNYAKIMPMIVSASYRSDIPAFHGAWFMERWRQGHVNVTNPYGGPARSVQLGPGHVTGLVFWTRNPIPFLPALTEITGQKVPFYLQITLTNYPHRLERSVPFLPRLLPVLQTITQRWGRGCWVWRYDPIVMGLGMDATWHRRNFQYLADQLSPLTDEVVFSFMQPYQKTVRNLRKASLDWRDPASGEKQELLADLGTIALARGLRPTLCAQPDLSSEPLHPARCIDADRLSRLSGSPLTARIKANRPGCLCAQAVDIGTYDSCAHGCVYCYAVNDPARTRQKIRETAAIE